MEMSPDLQSLWENLWLIFLGKSRKTFTYVTLKYYIFYKLYI